MNKKFIQQAHRLFTFLFMLGFCLVWTTQSAAQTHNLPKVTVHAERVPMTEVMAKIEQQTKFLFVVASDVPTDRLVSIHVTDAPLTDALEQMLRGADVYYDIRSLNILLKKRTEEVPVTISGTVRDAVGHPVIGATVLAEGTTNGASTDAEGHFTLTVASPSTARLEVSYLGYESQTLAVGSRTSFDITLKESSSEIELSLIHISEPTRP